MILRNVRIVFTYIMLLFICSAAVNANDNFPNRKLYPGLKYVELIKFQEIYPEVIVVDVRSKYEYDTLHIKGAVNYSRAELDFIQKMEKLRADNKGKTLVLYCNGRTCEQSYKAGKKCKDHHIDNVLVYDGGVFEFSTANPRLAILVGKEMGSADKLISKKMFDSHTVNYEKFFGIVNTNNTLIVDVRDKLQREGTSLFIGKEKRAEMSEVDKLDEYIAQAKRENKTLMIYDNAGKQVRWLQYFLEDRHVKDYYFMEGGAREYFKGLTKVFATKS